MWIPARWFNARLKNHYSERDNNLLYSMHLMSASGSFACLTTELCSASVIIVTAFSFTCHSSVIIVITLKVTIRRLSVVAKWTVLLIPHKLTHAREPLHVHTLSVSLFDREKIPESLGDLEALLIFQTMLRNWNSIFVTLWSSVFWYNLVGGASFFITFKIYSATRLEYPKTKVLPFTVYFL